MSTTAATFCATLVDEWVRAGVTDAFASPGSRSTPMALALIGDKRLRLHVFHDERSASFAALGNAQATGRPTVVTCTSGTAAAHFYAAVIEAGLAAVPLIVCTADRPPELWDVGAPQTVDQSRLYGGAIRYFTEPGVPTEDTRSSWRSIGARLAVEANGGGGARGPVHVNLSFRDPLVATPGELPPGRAAGRPWHEDLRGDRSNQTVSDGEAAVVWSRLRGLSGVLIAGNDTSNPTSVLGLARRLGWPVLADHRSGCRAEGESIAHADAMLRSERFAAGSSPDVVLRFGQPMASKVVSRWLSNLDAETIVAVDRNRWIDPERTASLVVTQAGLAARLLRCIPDDYRPANAADRWRRADELASSAIAEHLANIDHVTEPGIARAVLVGLDSGSSLVVASSMPVRDIEWFGPNRRDVRVYANRGANGIDGVIATAIGVALTGSPTTLLIGDVAFLHDSSSLIGVADRGLDLTIVVVDNDGGGIFSFLPQADQVAAEDFERLFGTPHGTDLVALCRAHGLQADPWEPGQAMSRPAKKGVRVLVANTDRRDNVTVHDQLHQAVASAIES